MDPGIHACGAHTAAHSRDYDREGEVRQIPPCFHSAILDFVEYCLHKIFCHALINNRKGKFAEDIGKAENFV